MITLFGVTVYPTIYVYFHDHVGNMLHMMSSLRITWGSSCPFCAHLMPPGASFGIWSRIIQMETLGIWKHKHLHYRSNHYEQNRGGSINGDTHFHDCLIFGKIRLKYGWCFWGTPLLGHHHWSQSPDRARIWIPPEDSMLAPGKTTCDNLSRIPTYDFHSCLLMRIVVVLPFK